MTIERFLVPGRHPADVQFAIAGILGRKLTAVRLRVIDDQRKPVAGADVRAGLSEGWTDVEGRLTLPVTRVRPGRGSGDAARARRGARRPGCRGRETEIAVGPQALAAFDVVDATPGAARGPVRVVLRGVDGTPDPNLGPDSLAYQAGNICFSRDGRFTVALPPGKYEAIIGRGPEYTLETRRFEVAYGRTAPVTAAIRRAFASPGWVIADLHNHSTMSNDSIADPRRARGWHRRRRHRVRARHRAQPARHATPPTSSARS